MDLHAAICRRELSSTELLLHYLGRLDRFNPSINAVVVDRRKLALEEAQEADRALESGRAPAPLHGIPMTIKESYDVAGLPTTWGATDLQDNIATRDSVAVQRLRRAGAVIYGKTNVPYLLADIQTYNSVYGTTNNPFCLELSPGGSSGGSAAALAAGLCALESGSDIGGSIRNPAHFCGVFGHKPTWIVLPPRGHAPPNVLSPTDIAVIGPLARSARDLDVAFRVMAGPDEIQARGVVLRLPELTERPSELRIAAWRDDDQAEVSGEVAERVDRVGEALRSMGARVDFEARPEISSEHTHFVYRCLLNATMTARQPESRYHKIEEFVESIPAIDTSRDSQISRSQIASFRDWGVWNEQRTHIRWAWHRFFQEFDFVVAPIMATAAFPHDHGQMSKRTINVNGTAQEMYRQIFWAGLASNAYLPATVIPTGTNARGLPIGVQIIGPEYSDLRTIGLARLLEAEGFAFVPPPGYE